MTPFRMACNKHINLCSEQTKYFIKIILNVNMTSKSLLETNLRRIHIVLYTILEQTLS